MNITGISEQIRKAFQTVKHPGKDRLIREGSGGTTEAEDIVQAFGDTSWQQVSGETLRYENAAMSFFSEAAFVYYLPAYMLFKLEHFSEADVVPDNLVSQLTMPAATDFIEAMGYVQEMPPELSGILMGAADNIDEHIRWFRDKTTLLSNEQSATVLSFLHYLNNNYADNFADGQIEKAINRYWFQFS